MLPIQIRIVGGPSNQADETLHWYYVPQIGSVLHLDGADYIVKGASWSEAEEMEVETARETPVKRPCVTLSVAGITGLP